MEVRSLIAKLGFGKIDTGPIAKAEEAISGFKKSAALLSVGMAGIVTAIGASVLSAIHFGDSLARTSQKIGVGVEDLQKLQYAATLADISSDELTQSLGLLSKRLFAAQAGSKEASKAFAKLGINPKNVNDTNQLVLSMADKFSHMKDGAQKAGLAMSIFGRSGLRMIPFLNMGSEKIRAMGKELEDLGLIFGKDFSKKAEEAHQNMERLDYIWKAFIRSTAAQMIPTFEKVTDGLLKWISANKDAIRTGLEESFHVLATAAKDFFIILQGLYKALEAIAEPFGGVEKVVKFLVSAVGLFLVIKYVKMLSSAIFAFQTSMFGITTPIGLILTLATAIALIGDDIENWAEGNESAFGSLYDTIADAFKKIKEAYYKYIDPWLTEFDVKVNRIKESINKFEEKHGLRDTPEQKKAKIEKEKQLASIPGQAIPVPSVTQAFMHPLNTYHAFKAARAIDKYNQTNLNQTKTLNYSPNQTYNINMNGAGDGTDASKITDQIKDTMGDTWKDAQRSFQNVDDSTSNLATDNGGG